MGRTKISDLTLKAENVLGETVQISSRSNSNIKHAWEEKDFTLNCPNCPNCIGREKAINIIKVVEEIKKHQNNEWIHPLNERILGICIWGLWPKILTPTNLAKKCRYFNERCF